MENNRTVAVVTLNAMGRELVERCTYVAAPIRLRERDQLRLAERALALMGLTGAAVESVYGDNGEIYVDLAGDDSEDDTPVSLRITLDTDAK